VGGNPEGIGDCDVIIIESGGLVAGVWTDLEGCSGRCPNYNE
jgi:hypothetical protein